MSRYTDIDKVMSTLNSMCGAFCPYTIHGRAFMCSSCTLGDVIDYFKNLQSADVLEIVHCQNCIYRGKPTECPFARYEQKQNPNYTTRTTTSPYADYVAQTIITAVDYTSDDDYCSRGVAWRKEIKG